MYVTRNIPKKKCILCYDKDAIWNGSLFDDLMCLYHEVKALIEGVKENERSNTTE